MFSISTAENSSRCASSEYTPGGRSGSVKSPSLLVVVCRFNPVDLLETVMATFGTTASWLSLTVPLSVAVLVCAIAMEFKATKFRKDTRHKNANEQYENLFIFFHPSSNEVLPVDFPRRYAAMSLMRTAASRLWMQAI